MSEYVRGSVYDTEDPQKRGRLRLLIPSILANEPSAWAEPVVPPAKSFKPKLGDVMWVFFENGNLNKPVYSSTAEITAAMLEADLILTSRIIVGDPNGERFEINKTQVIATDVDEQIVIDISPEADSVIQLLDSDGNTVAAINKDGSIVGHDLDLTGTQRIDGDNLLIDGQMFTDLLAQQPRGVQVYGSRVPIVTDIHSEFGIMEVPWTPPDDVAGRLEMLTAGLQVSVSGPDDVPWSLRLRLTNDGTQPHNTSPLFRRWRFNTNGGSTVNIAEQALWKPPGGVDKFRFLVTLSVDDGDSTHLITSVTDNVNFVITDVGDDMVANVALPNSGGGTTGGGGGDTGGDPPDRGPQTITKVYNSSRSGSYNGSGTLLHTGIDVTQGFYSTTNNNQRGAIWFPFVAIQHDLNGATVEKAEIYLYSNHWYYNDGGTAVIGFHTDTSGSVPSDYSTITGKSVDQLETHFPKPGGRWLNITSLSPDGWRTGGKTGLILGPGPTTDRIFYGKFNGPGQTNMPQLRLTYSK